MQGEQARQLFDAYLDGELSPPLAMELGAHRIHCPECRRALALLEVSGHIIASDRDPVDLSSGFSNRLLACMGPPGGRWEQRLRRVMYIGGPLAAAAVVTMAFLGVFDRDQGEWAGKEEVWPGGEQVDVTPDVELPDLLDEPDLPQADDHAERVLAEIRAQTPQPAAAPERGDRFMLAYDYSLRTPQEVQQAFGGAFAEEVFELEPGWHGPVLSGYGVHLVHITDRVESRLSEYGEVRDRLVNDFNRMRRDRANEALYEGLSERYEIEIDEAAIETRVLQ